MMKSRLLLASLILAAVLASGSSVSAQVARAAVPRSNTQATVKYLRTDLFFGRSRSDGTIVSVDDWNNFLAQVVTPRFPDGFTVLTALGQYRSKNGKIFSEPAEVIVFLYSRKSKKVSQAKIEEIRSAYVKLFDQESVLRVDLSKPVNVSF